MRNSALPHKLALGAILGAMLVSAIPSPATAAPLWFNDPTSYATATVVGRDISTAPLTFSPSDIGQLTSTTSDSSGNTATADLSGSVHPGPTLDLYLTNPNTVNGNPDAVAQLADGITVSGSAASTVQIPTAITVTGTITTPPLDDEFDLGVFTYKSVDPSTWIGVRVAPRLYPNF